MQCEADHLGSGLSDTLAELMAGSLLFIAQKLNLMSDSVLDGTLPILKAFKKSMVVSGCRHLESRLASPNSMILFATLCIPFIILLRLQGWDLVYYTSWHLLLNFFIVCIFMRSAYWADSFLQVFPDSISIQVSWPGLQNWKKKKKKKPQYLW